MAGSLSSAGSIGRSRWQQLARHLEGDLVLPGNAGYEVARQLELTQFDARDPRGVAYCASSDDVAVAVRFAQDQSLPVAVRSGGHSYGGYSTTTGLIIDVSRLDAVRIAEGAVLLGPGARNVDVLATLAPHELVVSEGGCATVATGGFLQGGGFGLLTRSLGLACDALTSAEVVLADGVTVTASADEHDDLFWALRGGGGGNFGVVTSFTVTPHRLDLVAWANLVFPYNRAHEVLHGFTEWMVDAPRTIGGGAYVVMTDSAPGSAPLVTVLLASTGDRTELATEIGRLVAATGLPADRRGGSLSFLGLEMIVFAQIAGRAELTPEQCARPEKVPRGLLTRPAFGVERTRFCSGPFKESGWADVLSAFDADRVPGQSRYLDVHMFGGAANDPGRTETAYVHRDALFSVNYRNHIDDPRHATAETSAAARRWVDRGFEAVDPFSNGESYQNWMDPAMDDWREAYYAENYPRLVRVKAGYDPSGFFGFAQGIGREANASSQRPG